MFKTIKEHKELGIHIIIWTTLFFIIYLQFYLIEGRDVPSIIFNRLGITILVFYINYIYLVPKLLLKRRILLYIASILIILIIPIFLFQYFFPINNSSIIVYNENSLVSKRLEYMGPIMFSIAFLIIGTTIRMYKEWNENEKNKKEIENQKITTELQFLKNQLNPHFLFNSLNSIYSLTKKKSNDAPEAVITLSELMRYMLYQTNNSLVLLRNELDYIQNYVKLQRLRIVNNEKVTLNIHGIISNQKIEPLLLISFIENAFKFGTDFKGNTEIKIVFYIKEDELQFTCTNLIGSRKKDIENSGIGLQNTRERLELLYPNEHWLFDKEEENRYIVDLTLKLK